MKFYRCEICGNIITHMNDSGVRVHCCGQPMAEMEAGSVDAAYEKHLPDIKASGNDVEVYVSTVEHPMEKVHYIEWIVVEKDKGFDVKFLDPGEAPKAKFKLVDGDTLKAAYEHCNLHGLWKTEA